MYWQICYFWNNIFNELIVKNEEINAMPIIFHVTTKSEWDKAQQNGFYESPSLKEEGLIHCSEENQVPGVILRYFKDQKNLVKLVVDTGKLTSQLVYEWSPSIEETFPHVYGPINLDAVKDVIPIEN